MFENIPDDHTARERNFCRFQLYTAAENVPNLMPFWAFSATAVHVT